MLDTFPRSKDEHLPEYPKILKIWNIHNQLLRGANNMKFQDVSFEMKKKLSHFSSVGYFPYSALNIHKMDLLEKYRDEYFFAAADHFIYLNI